MQWIIDNREFLFGGIGATFVGWLLSNLFKQRNQENQQMPTAPSINITNTQTSTQQSTSYSDDSPKGRVSNELSASPELSLDERKRRVRILFVDDDTKFKVVKILTNSGWSNTSIIKDANSLDQKQIIEADILFVDVQGVGIELGFKDEGLGLALAIKEKYPSKKVVIYSSETKGDRFHTALRSADSFLPKNADPYEFQKLVEDLST